MFPFIKDKVKQSGVTVMRMRSSEPSEGIDETDEALRSIALDLLSAISTNNGKMLASALRAAFEVCDASPHFEGKHIPEDQE